LPICGRLRILLFLGQIGDGDVGTFAGEGDGDGTADARVAARDERALALEPARADVAALAVVGVGRRLTREARLRLVLFGESLLAVLGGGVGVRAPGAGCVVVGVHGGEV